MNLRHGGMDGMKRNESFVFYLPHSDEASSSSSSLADPNAFRPGEGEQEIARACKMVIYYPPFSDNRTGILGTLYCTTLRLVFVPATGAEAETTEFRTSRVFTSSKYETSLLNICHVQFASSSDAKKLKPFTSFLQHLDPVVLVKIQCKDFRIFTFDFKSSEGHRALLNTMLRHAFPSRLTNVISVYRELSFPRSHHLSHLQTDDVPSFDLRPHWEGELRRTGAIASAWRVTHVNAGRRYAEGYPEYFVVPTLWLDSQISVSCSNWTHRRIPVWCWSSNDGCALVRSSTLNAVSELTDKQWMEVEIAIMETHPTKQPPIVVEAIASCQDVANAYEALRKLCSADVGSMFWHADTRWLTEVETTGWSSLVVKCLTMTEDIVSRISHNKQSVIFRESGNADIACVVSSLAQLCLDPYFRTMNGFAVLFQKEWIALSHPFAVRLFGLASDSRNDEGIAPVFLLFLDCVWQLCVQFPASFAFSSHYLIALWDLALTGLTRTFLFNNIRETANNNGYSMRSAWNPDAYFTPAYRHLFANPLYNFVYGLEPLAEWETPVRLDKYARSISVDDGVRYRRQEHAALGQRQAHYDRVKNAADSKPVVLLPNASIASYRFWDECYLRWSAPAQTLRGGRIQADMQLSAVLADTSHQLNELRYLRDQHEMERTKFGQQLRYYRVQPVSVSPDAVEQMTSAFPFGWETIPIPEYLYILPLRNEKQQQQGLTTPRSALELATFSMTPQAATLSCERLSVWGGGETSSFPEFERSPGALNNNDRRQQTISRRMNQSVIEQKTAAEPVLSELRNKLQGLTPMNTNSFESRPVNRKVSTDTMV